MSERRQYKLSVALEDAEGRTVSRMMTLVEIEPDVITDGTHETLAAIFSKTIELDANTIAMNLRFYEQEKRGRA